MNNELLTSIENPTLVTFAHFSHFSHFYSSFGPLHLSRTLYKSALFMQNKANFQKSQMNVSIFSKMVYENKSNWTLGENKPNSNPIKANFLDAQMNISSLLTKDYENQGRPPAPGKQTQSNPISKGALHYRVDAGILAPDTLSGVVEQRLSALGQPENNISTKH